jgi:hypothetical protein
MIAVLSGGCGGMKVVDNVVFLTAKRSKLRKVQVECDCQE